MILENFARNDQYFCSELELSTGATFEIFVKQMVSIVFQRGFLVRSFVYGRCRMLWGYQRPLNLCGDSRSYPMENFKIMKENLKYIIVNRVSANAEFSSTSNENSSEFCMLISFCFFRFAKKFEEFQ